MGIQPSKVGATLALAGAVVFASGCVMYQGQRVPNLIAAQAQPPALKEAPRIEVLILHRHTMEGDDVSGEFTGRSFDLMKSSFERVRADTPFLANAGTGIADPIYVLELDTEAAEHGEAAAFITGFTLFVIPAFVSSDVIVRARLKDADGALVSDREARGELKMVMHLLFLPITPFLPLMFSENDLIDDTFRDVFIQVGGDLEQHAASMGQ